jgi:hypothetical protein
MLQQQRSHSDAARASLGNDVDDQAKVQLAVVESYKGSRVG